MTETILIVDDEKELVEILDYNVRREGYATRLAYTGKEALRQAALASASGVSLLVSAYLCYPAEVTGPAHVALFFPVLMAVGGLVLLLAGIVFTRYPVRTRGNTGSPLWTQV